MDSLSQIVLGSAVAEATFGKKVGNKAILWGAIAGTIPDLDVISSWWLDDFTALSIHRGFSHSLVFCVLLSPLFGWLLHKLYSRKNEASWKNWSWMFFWCFVTHIALDCLTSWGTQVLWPLPHRFSTNSIFVVDPLYTIPFLGFVIAVMFFKRSNPKRARINTIGLIISTSYLAFGFVAKARVNSIFKESFAQQNIDVIDFESRPAPLNLFLWTANAETADGYYLGYASILDKDCNIDYNYVPKNHGILDKYRGNERVERVLFMTQGEYTVMETDSCFIVNDLRFGQPKGWESEPDEFVFRYFLYPEGDTFRVWVPDPPRPKTEEERQEMKEILGKIIRRAMGEKNP